MTKTEVRINGIWFEVYKGETYLSRFKNKSAAEQFCKRINKIMSKEIKVDNTPINIYF